MAVVTEYPSGAPCWFELATTDQAAAKQFYGELFGWSAEDSPMGPDQYYTTFKLDGRDVGAAYKLGPQLLEQGVPPHWGIYFSTPDADATAAQVTASGGSVMAGPFDVMEHGRMAVCSDPGGANFSIWQPKKHFGAGVTNEDNAFSWAELATWDTGQAKQFYESVFAWDIKSNPTYLEFGVGGEMRGGILAMDEQWKGIPSFWGLYLKVRDCDRTATKAKDLGGSVRVGPFDAPGVGRMAIMIDPQGAGFSIITLKSIA